jgi:hypothetical protein
LHFFFEKANFINTSKPWYEKYQAREQGYNGKGERLATRKQPTNPQKQKNKSNNTVGNRHA